MYKKLIIWLLCVSGVMQAQLLFDAEVSSDAMGIDEVIQVQYRIGVPNNMTVDLSEISPSFPDFRNFTVLSTQEYSSSVEIDGNSGTSMILIFILKPNKTGTLSIAPATLTYRNQEISTQSFEIKVTRDSSSGNQPKNPSPNGMKNGYLAFEVSDRQPYPDEGIHGRLVMYAVNPFYLNKVRDIEPPEFEGFNVRPIKDPISTIEQENKNGRVYFKRTLYEALLFPTRKGQITIPKGSAKVWVSNGFNSRKLQTINSANLKINVQDYPSNPPVSFTGAVGKFRLLVKPPKGELEVDKPITVKMELRGNGNLTLAKLPKLKHPKSINAIRPRVDRKIEISPKGEVGVLKQENILIPEEEGEVEVIVSAFSYFNPDTEKFVEIPAQKIQLPIGNGEKVSISQVDQQEENLHQEPKEQNTSSNVVIYTKSDEESSSNDSSGMWKWIGAGGGLVLLSFLAIVFFTRKNQNEDSEKESVAVVPVLEPEPKGFDFFPIENAHLQKDPRALYREIEEMLRFSKLEHELNTEARNEQEQLSTFLQTQKYAPFHQAENDEKLYQQASEFYKKYLA